MRLFEEGRFDGNLAELIDRCMPFVPRPEVLAEADRWLAGLEQHGRLLPVRKFAERANRGEVFTVGRRWFVPVDNETLAHLYGALLCGSVPQGDLEELYRSGALTLSWRLETFSPVMGSGVRTGQVRAPFRDQGLKLAHLIDAARGLASETEGDLTQRFRLTLNPLNCFPFPSPRRFRFEPLGGYADPGEAPRVQALLSGALAEHAGEAFRAYRARVGVHADPPSQWREAARDIRIQFCLRRPEERSVRRNVARSVVNQTTDHPLLVDSDDDAITTRGEPLRLGSLGELIDTLRAWRRACPSAERLNGHRTFLRANRTTGRQAISRSDPKPYVYFELTPACAHGTPRNAIRRWHLNGDTKAKAIDELIGLYEAQDSFDAIFRQEPVKTQQKLVLLHSRRSEGLYCYG